MKTAPLWRRDRLRQILADLLMPAALEALDTMLQRVDGGTLTAPDAIEQVLTAQIQLRNTGACGPDALQPNARREAAAPRARQNVVRTRDHPATSRSAAIDVRRSALNSSVGATGVMCRGKAATTALAAMELTQVIDS